MPYPVRPLTAETAASAAQLQAIAALAKTGAADRQKAIDHVVTAYGINQDHTKTLLYDAALTQPGRNVAGDVRIGPAAFSDDLPWLASIVFHELIHSHQYAYYTAGGVTQIDPKRSETERRMIALDEYEAYVWTWMRRAELGLTQTQRKEIERRAAHALIDLDDAKAKGLAQRRQFDAARDELVARLVPKPPAARIPSPNSPTMRCIR